MLQIVTGLLENESILLIVLARNSHSVFSTIRGNCVKTDINMERSSSADLRSEEDVKMVLLNPIGLVVVDRDVLACCHSIIHTKYTSNEKCLYNSQISSKKLEIHVALTLRDTSRRRATTTAAPRPLPSDFCSYTVCRYETRIYGPWVSNEPVTSAVEYVSTRFYSSKPESFVVSAVIRLLTRV
jgi:hypothetical protein